MTDFPRDPLPSAPASVEPGQVTAATPTLQVNPSKVQALAISLGLAAVATLSGATTVLSLARDKDLAGIVGFVQRAEGLTFITGAATLAAFAGIVVRTLRRKAREVYLAYHAKNRIAVVTKDIEPPKPPA